MLAVSVKLDERSIAEAKYILRAIPRAWPRVARRAINRTVDSAATDLKRKASEQIVLKKSEIAKGIGKHKASYANLTGSIDTTAYRPGLIRFPGTKEKRPHGVSYRISRTEGRKVLPHGFEATMPSGHRGAFLRSSYATGSYKPMASKPAKEAIHEAHGPSIWQVIANTPGLLDSAQQRAGDQLGKNINDQIGVELRRWRNR